ncbi:MAG: glycosyltransferase family 39 protein [Acidobacteriota bacterium]|nr:glycosyltransferase family 39 protein [Acidobacteriota bacterium]
MRSHALSLGVVACLLALAAFLIGTGITRYPGFADDEGTYVAEAWAVMTHGQLSHYTYWYDHPPLGWVQLGLLTSVFGGLVHGATAIATARSLMLLPALATTALLYGLARRLDLRRGFAALAVLTLIVSPLGIYSLREVYLENFALPWLLAAFFLAATPRAKLWAFAGSGACFAAAVLSKETMLLFLPGLLLAVVTQTDRRTRAFCLAAFGLSFVLVAGVYPLMAVLKGELLPGRGHVSLEQAVVWQLVTRQATGSALDPHSAARQVIDGWLRTDAWLLGLGLGSVPLALLVRRLRPIALALAVAVLTALHGGYLPEPFDIGLLPFCALLPAGLLNSIWDLRPRVSRWWPYATRGFALALTAVLVAVVAPQWLGKDRAARSLDLVRPATAAEHWIETHIQRRARLIVDDTMYVDLVDAGFRPRYGVVWFSKLSFASNLDPAIRKHLPHGWHEFDFVIDSPGMRNSMYADRPAYSEVFEAIAHSRTLRTFGHGPARIQIRVLEGVGVGSWACPRCRVTKR